jgi:multidrug efflux pump subunit AcrB
MQKIFKFQEFINEKYEENPEYRIKSFFEELEKNIKDWFDDGTFGANGAELGEIKRSMTSSMEKNMIFDFNDDEFYYQVYIIMSIKDVGEDSKLDECYIKVKKYDNSTMKLLRYYGEDVNISDLNEDKILEMISKLDEESTSLELQNGEVSISDEDSDLEDTSLV